MKPRAGRLLTERLRLGWPRALPSLMAGRVRGELHHSCTPILITLPMFCAACVRSPEGPGVACANAPRDPGGPEHGRFCPQLSSLGGPYQSALGGSDRFVPDPPE